MEVSEMTYKKPSVKRIKKVEFSESVGSHRLRVAIEGGKVTVQANHETGDQRDGSIGCATFDEDTALAFFEAVVSELSQGKAVYRGGE
jgi:hypothetical protein